MSSYANAKPSKLKFKGEVVKKKKRSKRKRESEEPVAEKKTIHGSWWPVTELEHLKGPVILQFSSGKYLFAEVNATLKAGDIRDPDELESFDPAEVFTAVRVGEGCVTLKSGYDRYVGTNTYGKLTGYAEAIGSLETWEVEIEEEVAHLKSAIGKYMSVEEDGTVHCIEKEKGPTTAIRVWSGSAPLKTKAKANVLANDLQTVEKNAAKQYQSYMGRGYDDTKLSKEELKVAQKEGRLNEALLERRTKFKADRYCK